MASKEEPCVFVGGLAWETTERDLISTFSRFGKVVDAQGVEKTIDEMHGRKLNGRIISVNLAEPKIGDDGPRYGGGARASYGRGGRGDKGLPVGGSKCFKCGRPGHWARECPSGGGDDGRYSSRSRYSGGHVDLSDDRFVGDRSDRYADDRFDGVRYGERDHIDSRDSRYRSREPRGRLPADRYPHGGDIQNRGVLLS